MKAEMRQRGLHGSRRAASGAPHHEGLRFRREPRPHPEEPAKGGRLEGWATERPSITIFFMCGSLHEDQVRRHLAVEGDPRKERHHHHPRPLTSSTRIARCCTATKIATVNAIRAQLP